MPFKSIRSAPQLTRLLRELPASVLDSLLRRESFLGRIADDGSPGCEADASPAAGAHGTLTKMNTRDLAPYEDEATRITRLDNPRADALHLRLADGVDHDCRREVEAIAGPLARSAHTYCQRPALFRSIERAMQLRNYREHRRIYEAHEILLPVDVTFDKIDTNALGAAIVERLDLSEGCDIEAVELPNGDSSDREIMLAVVAGGALASQKTFERDKGIDMIHYRPAAELILVYRPSNGSIEVCGRDWSDRTAVAHLFARHALGEDLSQRPLKQRNYDLRPLARSLAPEIPPALADRIITLHITEARFALGNYDRKITVSALAGEPITKVARDMLRGVGSRHGQPFLCDVEFFLRVSSRRGQPQSLRFRVTNQNRSTLQSETDPDKKNLGFVLLEALGVVTTSSQPGQDAVTEDLLGLLQLLEHEVATIGWNELRELGIDISRFTRRGYLHQKTIAATALIEDDELGPLEARVLPDVGAASLGLAEGDAIRKDDLDPLLSWTIHRPFVRETILETLEALEPKRPVDCGHDLFDLGNCMVGGERRPTYLWERSGDLKAVEKVDRMLRDRRDKVSGLVLTLSESPIRFLGKHMVVSIPSFLDDDRVPDLDLLATIWAENLAAARAADGIVFEDCGDRAVLTIPRQDPWTIVGWDRVELVRKLYSAWKRGDEGAVTADLISHTKSTSPQAILGPDWKPLILNRYIYSPRRGHWALKVPSA
jgi:hypothetical protein